MGSIISVIVGGQSSGIVYCGSVVLLLNLCVFTQAITSPSVQWLAGEDYTIIDSGELW